MNRVLITGGAGCIGAAASYVCARRGVDEIVVLSRSGRGDRLHLWFGGEIDPRVRILRGDVSDADGLRRLVAEVSPTHVIHLGAFQTPACDAEPWRGMEINAGGTLNLVQAAARCGSVQRFVFASSAAVYGPRSLYEGPRVRESDPLRPANLYGVWKLASEHLARLYHEQTGVPTVCLRLNTVYGKGRDLGKTSAPTAAIKAVAAGFVRGRPIRFRMPYTGRENYHYVEDAGAHFAAAALDPFEGYGVFNMRGRTVAVEEFLGLVARAARELGMGEAADLGIAEDAEPALFVYDLDDTAVERAFPGVPLTPLETGIRSSLEAFVALARAGKLDWRYRPR